MEKDFDTIMAALSKKERLEFAYKNRKKPYGRIIGIELTNIYSDDIFLRCESMDYQENFNVLLKDIKLIQ